MTWNHAGGAASYNVLRSTTSGSGYALRASGVTANRYLDTTGTANGTTYYYVVQSVNAAGATSGFSPEAAARPVAPGTATLAAPWNDLDIGTSTGGSATTSGGTFTVKSGPGDLYGNADGCHFVWQPLLGDGTVIARVQSQSSTNGSAKTGLAIRSSLAAGATRFSVSMKPMGRAEFNYRGGDGGNTLASTSAGGLTLPYWVRLTRSGSTVTGSVSPDGTTWTTVGSYNAMVLPYAAYVGLVTCPANGNAGQTNTAVFTNVNFPLGATALPAAPTGLAAVGGEGNAALTWTTVPGAASYNVKRASASGGPFNTVANVPVGTTFTDFGRPTGTTVYYVVSAVNGAGESADSAVASATPVVAPAAVGGLAATANSNRVTLSWTAVPGATGYTVRRGTRYGLISTVLASGLTATTFTDATAVNHTTYLYAVTASVNTSEGPEDVVVATPPGLVAPWQTRDIGAVDLPGAGTSTDGAAFTLSGSGHDIWGTSDEFRFVYQAAAGDGTITARVADIASPNGTGKVGVMIRNTLDANSAYANLFISPGNSATVQKRNGAGAGASSVAGLANVPAPYWVRLKRLGNAITAHVSPDGTANSWTQVGGTQTIAMNATAHFGLALTSVSDGNLATARYDGVVLTGPAPGAPTGVTPTPGNHAVTLVWSAAPRATGYTVRRSLSSGSGYAVVASNIPDTGYTDPGLANGTTYYYRVSANNATGESPDSAVVSAMPRATFAAWQAQYFTAAQMAVPAVSGPNGDANGDGFKNVLAYAFNVSPWENLAGALPKVAMVNGTLTISYIRRKPPTDVTYRVAASGDLLTWNNGATDTTETGVVPLDADTELVTARDNSSASAGGRFLRLEIGY